MTARLCTTLALGFALACATGADRRADLTRDWRELDKLLTQWTTIEADEIERLATEDRLVEAERRTARLKRLVAAWQPIAEAALVALAALDRGEDRIVDLREAVARAARALAQAGASVPTLRPP